MGGGKNSSPPAPDYAAAATAQGAANIAAGINASNLSNPNMVTPYGSSTFTAPQQIGTDSQGNPIYGRPTETQTLSPAEQGLLTSSQGAQQSALNILNSDMPNISSAISSPFTFNPSPIYGGYAPGTGPVAGTQYTPGNSGPIQGNVAPASMLIPSVEQAQYQQGQMFLDPQFKQAQAALTSSLANQGITPGSTAYTTAENNLALQQTGAEQNNINNAITGGQQAAQAMFGENLAGGQFANSAQAQQFGQLLNAMQARNAAVQGQAQIASNQTSLANAAQGQGFQQYTAQRTLPINMLTALLSAGQVSNPTFNAYSPTSINPSPVMQGAALQGQANTAANNAKKGTMGSGLGAVGSGLGAYAALA